MVARSRLGIVLLVPPPLDREVDGLRRACGDTARHRVRPHITLVPPVNVRADDVPAALARVRDAAAEIGRPLHLRLGPPDTFLPDSATLHLAVDGSAEDLAALRRLHDLVLRPPLARSLAWPFVPHVTLADEASPERIAAGLAALADYQVEVAFDEVHVLREELAADRSHRWVPVADHPLRPRAVVGRGGVALELSASARTDPEALAFEAAERALAMAGSDEGEASGAALVGDAAGPAGAAGDEPAVGLGVRPVVVVARREGQVVGLARGWVDASEAVITTVVVAAAHRGQGIARHLRAALLHEAARHQGTGW